MKAKTCPYCGDQFYQRKGGRCRSCGMELTIVKGVAKQPSEVLPTGAAKEIYTRFQELKLEIHKEHILHQGKNYVRELHAAKQIISKARTFLGYCSDGTPITYDDAIDFALQVLEYAMRHNGWLKGKTSLFAVNGRIFDGAAPIVYEKLERDMKARKVDLLFTTGDVAMQGMLSLG